MKASEAKQLVYEFNLQSNTGIYSQIREKAESGHTELVIDDWLSSHTVEQLRNDGYKVDDVGGDYFSKYRITW